MARQARAEATRGAIVQAAGLVFARTSYAAATLTQVIAQAGVTQGSLYFHFDSKQDLALEVVRLQHERSIAVGMNFLAGDGPGLDALVELSSALAHQMKTDPIVTGGLRLTTESPELFPEYVKEPYTDWISTGEALIRRAQDDGDIALSLDAHSWAGVVIACFTGVQVVSQAMSRWDDLFPRLELMWHALLPSMVSGRRAGDVAELAALSRSKM
ncbi:ScbR family autoregulator-binding transcription factor [Agreia sp. COWG]|uniref:ScbR family autoregulator-binding transcription factor n=1 Tax=Agreia sp. COWG TaxID=2773266 RepID=UPI001925BB9A|nr:ScbR family autoregulator-binding transcription factor [Agreia sp. COWG]CAD5990913.1 AcrR family transcriptional regulator [Agreia sp. COWG]